MVDYSETKRAVLYWYDRNDSEYFSQELYAAMECKFGHETAAIIERDLDTIASQFKSFREGNSSDITSPVALSPRLTAAQRLITQTFLYSGQAYAAYKCGNPGKALALLRVSMELDIQIRDDLDLLPITAHYFQSRHNICRVLASKGRNLRLGKFLRSTLEMLLEAIPRCDARNAVLLELMGIQIFEYYLQLIELRAVFPLEIMVSMPSALRKSHLSNNVTLYNCIVRKDQSHAMQILKNQDSFVLREFKKYINVGVT